MRKLLILITFVSSLTLLPTTSYAEWTKVDETVDGDSFYIDFERVRKHGGYVYYWVLHDYLKPNKNRVFSRKDYIQMDCGRFGVKFLSIIYYELPMGEGTILKNYNYNDEDWKFPPSETIAYDIIKRVCAW